MKIYTCSIICLLTLAFAGASQSTESPVPVNFLVDMDLPASPTTDQIEEAETYFANINHQMNLETRSCNFTIPLVQDASLGDRLYFAGIALGGRGELAISGNHSNEKLSEMSYEEQKAILERSAVIVEAAKVCGKNEIVVMGFMPQSFDQNENTYKVLDEMGVEYNTGFQAGIIYAPGHENDVWPYKVENHEFYAVPVSTVAISGEKVPLDDRTMMDKGVSASQWYDLLVGKFDEISGKDEPMVVSLSTSVSGKGDYLDALTKFMAYAETRAKFVSTHDLLVMKGLSTPSTISKCKTCGSKDNTALLKNISENITI